MGEDSFRSPRLCRACLVCAAPSLSDSARHSGVPRARERARRAGRGAQRFRARSLQIRYGRGRRNNSPPAAPCSLHTYELVVRCVRYERADPFATCLCLAFALPCPARRHARIKICATTQSCIITTSIMMVASSLASQHRRLRCKSGCVCVRAAHTPRE